MKYHRLGNTDVEGSAVAMGCWAIVDDATWGPQDESDALDAIAASLDAGVTLFDTAEAYGDGRSEELLGRAFKGRRDQAVIADKVRTRDQRRADVIAACERALQRLRTDTIDLYQLHWPSRDVPFDETAEALQTLLDQGKIRAAGVSNFGPRDLADFTGLLRPATNQIAYNLLFRAPEHELLPACAAGGIGVLCYSPLAEALLTGKFAGPDDVPEGRARTRHFSGDRELVRHGEPGAEVETFEAVAGVREVADGLGLPMAQVALAWLLHQEGVVSVIAGARNARQASENAAAGDVTLPDDAVARLDQATAALRDKLGTNLDMWQSESRIR